MRAGIFTACLALLCACGGGSNTKVDAGAADAGARDAAAGDAVGMDAVARDAMAMDAVAMDAMPARDAIAMDAIAMDAIAMDAVAMDAMPPDAVPPDAVSPDAMPVDSGPADAGDPCAVNNGGCDPLHGTCSSTTGAVTCRCEAGYAGDGRTCQRVAASLSGLRWQLPCVADSSPTVCTVAGMTRTSTTLSGAPGLAYDVTFRFRGVVEQKTYTGGTNDGAYFQIGGAPAADGFNVYRLEISSPQSTYFLNRGMSSIYQSFPIDYTATIRVAAGATVTLSADAIDGYEIKNVDAMGRPIVVPGIPPAPAAYAGQFIQMDVLAVVPR